MQHSDNLNPEECNCKCHRNKEIKHVRACCWKCPNCGKNILFIFEDEHKKKCNIKSFERAFINESRIGNNQ